MLKAGGSPSAYAPSEYQEEDDCSESHVPCGNVDFGINFDKGADHFDVARTDCESCIEIAECRTLGEPIGRSSFSAAQSGLHQPYRESECGDTNAHASGDRIEWRHDGSLVGGGELIVGGESNPSYRRLPGSVDAFSGAEAQ